MPLTKILNMTKKWNFAVKNRTAGIVVNLNGSRNFRGGLAENTFCARFFVHHPIVKRFGA